MRLKQLNFALIVFALGGVIFLVYLTTFLFTVTDNAFVVSNTTPITAAVNGYVTEIYVKNGQNLQAGDPIIKIGPLQYEMMLEAVEAQYKQGLVGIEVLEYKLAVTHSLLNSAITQLHRLDYEYEQKSDPSVRESLLAMDIKFLEFNKKSQQDVVQSLRNQVDLESSAIRQAKVGIDTLKVAVEKAKIDLEETTVRAKGPGYIQNLFAAVGTPVLMHAPLFLYVDTSETYIQANFNETDLANVHAGDKVLIFPRMYLWHKVFHGVVMSSNWSVDRQYIVPVKDTQVVPSINHWLNLPQRFPVQIKVLDADNKYLLRPGMSSYVYVR